MMKNELIRHSKIVNAISSIHATTGHATTAAEVNASGWSWATWIFNVGAMDATAVLEAEVQQASSTGGTFADVTSAALTDVASTAGSNAIYIISHAVAAGYPYLKIAGTCGTARATVGAICILTGRNGVKRVDHGAGELIDL